MYLYNFGYWGYDEGRDIQLFHEKAYTQEEFNDIVGATIVEILESNDVRSDPGGRPLYGMHQVKRDLARGFKDNGTDYITFSDYYDSIIETLKNKKGFKAVTFQAVYGRSNATIFCTGDRYGNDWDKEDTEGNEDLLKTYLKKHYNLKEWGDLPLIDFDYGIDVESRYNSIEIDSIDGNKLFRQDHEEGGGSFTLHISQSWYKDTDENSYDREQVIYISKNEHIAESSPTRWKNLFSDEDAINIAKKIIAWIREGGKYRTTNSPNFCT